MESIKNAALNYVEKVTKNISDLDIISIDEIMTEREHTKKDGTPFKIKVIQVDGEDFRVPDSVLRDLQVMLNDNPGIKYFKVKKSGDGSKTNTKYTVIPTLAHEEKVE